VKGSFTKDNTGEFEYRKIYEFLMLLEKLRCYNGVFVGTIYRRRWVFETKEEQKEKSQS